MIKLSSRIVNLLLLFQLAGKFKRKKNILYTKNVQNSYKKTKQKKKNNNK